MCSGYSSEQKETGPLPPAAYSAVLRLNMWLNSRSKHRYYLRALIKNAESPQSKKIFLIFNAESQVPDQAY